MPEDLQIKVGSKAEQFWTNILNKIEEETQNARYTVELNLDVIEILKTKIKKEQEDFQKEEQKV